MSTDSIHLSLIKKNVKKIPNFSPKNGHSFEADKVLVQKRPKIDIFGSR